MKLKSPVKKDFYAELGQTIRLGRKRAGKSQEEAAGFLGVSFQQFQKYEKGTNRIPMDRLFSLSKYLGIPQSEIFRTGEMSSEQKKLRDSLDSLGGREFQDLIEVWTQIKDRRIRMKTLELIKNIATFDS